MTEVAIAEGPYDFSAMHEAIQSFVDRELIACVASVVLKDNEIVDTKTWGYADVASRKPSEMDTIYRIYSNTKIVTSVAALMLLEEGKFELDDPIDEYLPQLSNRQVVKDGDINNTEPAETRPTVRQLMCHNAGFSYGFLMESPVDARYNELDMLGTGHTLADMVDKLADVPLAYQPGARWQYSVSTDVLARLVEVWSGLSFSDFLQQRIFVPLQMKDTGFHVPEDKHPRFATQYAPVDPLDPMKPGLDPMPSGLLGDYLEPRAFTSGGGGLVSTIVDYTRFIRMLVGNGEFDGVRLLKEDTVKMMATNQLPDGELVQLPNWVMPDTVFGLGVAIKTAPREGEPKQATGEFHWGGMAGTHSWIAPEPGIAALIFTQRMPGFWHEFSHEFKRQVYSAICK